MGDAKIGITSRSGLPGKRVKRRAQLGLAGVAACLPLLGAGCGIDARIRTPRTATQQLLQTEAIDRALLKLDWPDMSGKTVIVDTGPPGDAIDTEYLRVALEILAAERGFRLSDDPDEADLELALLSGALSLNISGRLLGLQGTGGGLIPFTIPEVALYRRVRTRGFAKLRMALLDRATQGVVFSSDPVEGRTFHTSFTALFVIKWSRSDLSEVYPDADPY